LSLHQHEDDGKIPTHNNFESNLQKWLLLELENPRSLYLIIEVENIPVGFVGATSILNDNGFLGNPIKGVIQLLWIVPEYRKKRAAELLLEEVEHCFRQIGIKYVECTYTVTNQLAEYFWEKQGYKKNSVTARKII